MYEKEAEDYANRTRIKDKNTYVSFDDERISGVQDYEGNYIDISERIIKTFKDGANIGYNKAKEEMQENGLALQSDMDKTIEQNIQLKNQIEKMKCCANCKFDNLEPPEVISNGVCENCINHCKWKLED